MLTAAKYIDLALLPLIPSVNSNARYVVITHNVWYLAKQDYIAELPDPNARFLAVETFTTLKNVWIR